MNKIRSLITGGAGFIGTATVKRLLSNGYTVIIYDLLNREPCKLQHENLEVVQGDVLDHDKLNYYTKMCDCVIHMAATLGVETVVQHPVNTTTVNITGTANALEAAKKAKVNKFLYFSTSEVYGPQVDRYPESYPTPIQPATHPRWAYGASKLAGEHLVYSYHFEFGMNTIIFRPFNIYGPNQTPQVGIHVLTKRAVNNEPILIYGTGSQVRAYCFIEDIVDAIMLALHRPVYGEIFNIGNPKEPITVLDLAMKIKEMSNSKSKVSFVAGRDVNIEYRVPNIYKAETKLGYSPKVSLKEGLRRTIEWCQQSVESV